MRGWRWVWVLGMAGGVAPGQGPRRTDVELDGLVGAVKSVSTVEERTGVRFRQPDGPTMVSYAGCAACEFDAEGWRTRTGSPDLGWGERFELTRDGRGAVTGRTTVNLKTGTVTSVETLGPWGTTSRVNFLEGRESGRSDTGFDSRGRLTDYRQEDQNGVEQRRRKVVFGANVAGVNGAGGDAGGAAGRVLRDTEWDHGVRVYAEVYHPDTGLQEFVGYDAGGAIQLKSARGDGGPIRFWQMPGTGKMYGSGYTERDADGSWICTACHDDRCETSRVRYEYAGEGKRNPVSVEWRDTAGKLLYGGYFEYDLDGVGNWTRRKVWVTSAEVGERVLLEEDRRAIGYWGK